MKVIFKNSFVKDLQKIKDHALATRVRQLIETLEDATTIQDLSNLKQLKGATSYYRMRVGDYRLGLSIEGETVTLIRFLHRKDVYRYFP
ncbi:MAG: type II toxin-antitoxin system RelE family toxin [Anaerolineales bacterium]